MSNMGYCRHENTARDLAGVWDLWDDWSEESATPYERRGRLAIVRLVREMYESFEFEGAYGEVD